MRTFCLVVIAALGCGGSTPPPAEPPPPPPPAAHLDIADDARPLVDAWAEALGGREAIARLGTVHMKGDCAFAGRTCMFESFLSPKGELRYAVTFLDGGIALGFDGTSAWQQEGEVVTDVTGSELEEVLRPAFLESYSMFFEDRLPGSITRDGASSLAILPRGATAPVVVRFRTDGLPVSAESPGHRVVYTAWNEYLGVQIAQAWTSGETGSENTFRLASVDDQAGTYAKPPR